MIQIIYISAFGLDTECDEIDERRDTAGNLNVTPQASAPKPLENPRVPLSESRASQRLSPGNASLFDAKRGSARRGDPRVSYKVMPSRRDVPSEVFNGVLTAIVVIGGVRGLRYTACTDIHVF